MSRIQKTVFLSYRRTDGVWALTIYNWLTQHGYDVFIDFEGIGSGAFATVIVENILDRAHFIVLLSPTALDRCDEPDDWLRREIETAMRHGRNIVPIMVGGFSFRAPNVAQKLTGLLAELAQYNGLEVSQNIFSTQMERLSNRSLNVALDAVPHPPNVKAIQIDSVLHAASEEAIKVAREQQLQADSAAEDAAHKYFFQLAMYDGGLSTLRVRTLQSMVQLIGVSAVKSVAADRFTAKQMFVQAITVALNNESGLDVAAVGRLIDAGLIDENNQPTDFGVIEFLRTAHSLSAALQDANGGRSPT